MAAHSASCPQPLLLLRWERLVAQEDAVSVTKDVRAQLTKVTTLGGGAQGSWVPGEPTFSSMFYSKVVL